MEESRRKQSTLAQRLQNERTNLNDTISQQEALQNYLNNYQEFQNNKELNFNDEQSKPKTINAIQNNDLTIDTINTNNQVQEKDRTKWYEWLGNTISDTAYNLMYGATKSMEGVVDFFMALNPNWEDLVKKDLTAQAFSKQARIEQTGEDSFSIFGDWGGKVENRDSNDSLVSLIDSVTNNGNSGLLQAVGQQLPRLSLAILTGGTSEGIANATKIINTIGFATSASGGAIEEALNEDADLGQAWAYGIMSGAVELGTEQLGNFLGYTDKTLFKGLTDNAIKEVSKNLAARTALGLIEEGAEEVISDALSPLEKYIAYQKAQGKELELASFNELSQSFIIGALSAGVLEGGNIAINKLNYGDATIAMHAQDINSNYIEINNIYQREKNIIDNGGELSAEQIHSDVLKINELTKEIGNSYKNIENRMQGLSAEKQQKVIDKFTNAYTYEYKDETTGDIKKENIDFIMKNYNVANNGYGDKFYSDLELSGLDIQKDLHFNMILDADNETLESNKKNIIKSVKLFNYLNKISNNKLNVLFTNDDNIISEGEFGKTSKNNIIINVNKNDLLVKTLGHEWSHTLEKNKGYNELVNDIINEIKKNESKYLDGKTFEEEFNNKNELYKKVVGKDADEKYINEEISADFIGKYLIDNDTLMQKYIVGKQSIFQKIKKSIQSLFKNKNELNLTKEENKYLEEIYEKVNRVAEKRTNDILSNDIRYSLNDDYDLDDLDDLENDIDFEKFLKDLDIDLKDSEEYNNSEEEVKTYKKSFIEELYEKNEKNRLDNLEKDYFDYISDKTNIITDDMRKYAKEMFKNCAYDDEDYYLYANMQLSKSFIERYKDSVVRASNRYWATGDKNSKYLMPMYHGTPSNTMDYFDVNKVGRNGTVRGIGFYATSSYQYAQSYNGDGKGKVLSGFVNITKPLSEIEITLNKSKTLNFFKNISDYELPKEYLDKIFSKNSNDVDIIKDIFNMRNSTVSIKDFYKSLKDYTGYDGILYRNRAEGTIAVFFNSNQFKSFDNINPSDDERIRYSLADFNAEETEKRRKTIKNRLLSEEEFENKNDLFVGFFKESGKYNFFNANNELGFYIDDDDFYSQTNFKAELEFRKKSPFVYITYFKTKGNIVSTGNFNASDVFIKSNEFLNSIPREDNNNFAGIKGIEFNLGDKKVLITRTAIADMHTISTNGEIKISIYEIDGKQMTIFSGNQGECYIRNQIKLSDEDMKYVFKYNLTNNVATENKLKEESVKNTITSYKDLSGNAKDFVSKTKEYIDNYGANEGLLKLREIYPIKDEEFSFIVDFLVEKRGYKAEDFDKNLLGIKENALQNNENMIDLESEKERIKNLSKKYDGSITIDNRSITEDFTEQKREKYQSIKKEAISIIEKLEKNKLPNQINENETNKIINIAPYYASNVINEESYNNLSANFNDAIEKLKHIAEICGCDFKYTKSFGVYQNEADNFYQLEPSFVVNLGKISLDTSNLVASLFADDGYQQQEASICSYETDINNWDNNVVAFDIEYNSEKISTYEVAKIMQQKEIDCTVTDGNIRILDFSGDINIIKENMKQYETLLEILKDKGVLYESKAKQISVKFINSTWVDANFRETQYQDFNRTHGFQGSTKSIQTNEQYEQQIEIKNVSDNFGSTQQLQETPLVTKVEPINENVEVESKQEEVKKPKEKNTKSKKEKGVSQWKETARNSVEFRANFTEDTINILDKSSALTYQVVSNQKTVELAIEENKKFTIDGNKNYIINKISENKVLSDIDVARATLTLEELIRNNRIEEGMEFLDTLSKTLTQYGKSIQLASLINRLTPEGKLRLLEKNAVKIDENNAKIKSNKNANKRIAKKMRDTYLNGDIETVKRNVANIYALEIIKDQNNFENEKAYTQQDVEGIVKQILDEVEHINNIKEYNLMRILINMGMKTRYAKKLASDMAHKFNSEIETVENMYENYKSIIIPLKLKDAFLKAKNEEARKKASKDIEYALAVQTKVSFYEKVQQWRYLAMLANAKTHIRNIVSNFVMHQISKVKDNVAIGVEKAFSNLLLNEKTNTFQKVSKEMNNYAMDLAEKTFENFKDSQSKYNSKNPNVQVFNTKAIEKLRVLNSNLLENVEDKSAFKKAFAYKFGKWATVNNYSIELLSLENNADILNKGIEISLTEALEQTYKDYSVFVASINQLKAKSKIADFVISTVMPFTKTPVNIARRGIEYSPIGLAKAIGQINKVKNGSISATTWVNNMSKGLTGTMITLLGILLAKLHFVTGGNDDEKEDKYTDQLGKKAFSIKIGNRYYTLDWLAPASIPFFTGVSIWNTITNGIDGDDFNLGGVFDVVSSTLDPLTEMTFLQSLNSALESYNNNTLVGISQNMSKSYVSSFIPTAMSQLVKTFSPNTRRTSATTGDSKYFWNSLKAKIPFLYDKLQPYIDVWGREDEKAPLFQRFADNMIFPFWSYKDEESPVDNEILSLYSKNENSDIIPTTPKYYYTKNGEKIEMSGKEYTTFKKEYGNFSYNSLEALFNSDYYKSLNDEEKENAIKKIYNYASSYAKHDKIYTYAKVLELGDSYGSILVQLNSITSDLDDDGETITNSKKLNTFNYINKLKGLNKNQKYLLFVLQGYKLNDNANNNLKKYLKQLVYRKVISKEEYEDFISTYIETKKSSKINVNNLSFK